MDILIIEDEKDIVEALEYNLKKEGFNAYKAFDGINGLRMAKEKSPHLIILDLMLPGIDGIELFKTLKKDERTMRIPVIMLTAKSGEVDKVLGLELGADDYISKPFSMRELIARAKNALRRYGKNEKPLEKSFFKVGDLEINADKHEVKVKTKKIDLTAKEFDLLKYLVENRGRAINREKLLDEVWGIEVAIETRTVDVHVRRLREKLGKKIGDKIITLIGVGYKFSEK